ncbi:MAG: electron transfer flavoprotein subunit alpha/FixB family protein [Flavobacteriales bacterium]|nr:electron transfer flavoprotein subunit alpha/FixB family protein [Flavobacteriales bacterium]MBL6873669.1 electron transfer flavoprotein subunit alpha/FixB family protein [Flavobacteriales bacterium]
MSVVVFAESWNGTFKKGTFEILTYAHDVAKKMDAKCIALTIGNISDDIKVLAKYGADKVLSISNNFDACDNKGISSAIAQIADAEGAKILILSNTNTGKTIGPRIAVKMDASFISNSIEVPTESSPLVVKKKSFSGKAFEMAQSHTDKTVIALSPNAYSITENNNDSCEFTTVDCQVDDTNVTSIKVEKASGKISLAEAEIVISAGRGLKGPDNWGMIEELADLLNAGTACSKPVSDIGWRPHSEHVGQTGKAIAPNLYIAIGISGAIQHLAGVNSSKVMVAINTDPEAPFFKAADYGIVGDAFEVVPRLIEEIKQFKSSN